MENQAARWWSRILDASSIRPTISERRRRRPKGAHHSRLRDSILYSIGYSSTLPEDSRKIRLPGSPLGQIYNAEWRRSAQNESEEGQSEHGDDCACRCLSRMVASVRIELPWGRSSRTRYVSLWRCLSDCFMTYRKRADHSLKHQELYMTCILKDLKSDFARPWPSCLLQYVQLRVAFTPTRVQRVVHAELDNGGRQLDQ